MSPTRIQHCWLYGILDLEYVQPADARRVAAEMVAGGVDILQLRAKKHPIEGIRNLAANLHDDLRTHAVPFLINDHAELAAEIGAEGVHVGQDDLPVVEARRIAGEGCVVGKSTHSLEQARRAADEGADYIGFGPLFATPTKPDYAPIGLGEIAALHAAVRIPIFCIGGVKLENLRRVIFAKAERVVIVSGLLQAPDIAQYARSAKALLVANES